MSTTCFAALQSISDQRNELKLSMSVCEVSWNAVTLDSTAWHCACWLLLLLLVKLQVVDSDCIQMM
jgi:hypothetical protein